MAQISLLCPFTGCCKGAVTEVTLATGQDASTPKALTLLLNTLTPAIEPCALWAHKGHKNVNPFLLHLPRRDR